ncbi:hypothetical protein CK203_060973 [Vitis vinifera]|uniref:Uncharacterized protein n=1 Tax=Vitis vinifera TaxID=29760 RepID=A0A438G988_VITVI|nr:hypothetical protein CK203_060973 [Vitis vinifera]
MDLSPQSSLTAKEIDLSLLHEVAHHLMADICKRLAELPGSTRTLLTLNPPTLSVGTKASSCSCNTRLAPTEGKEHLLFRSHLAGSILIDSGHLKSNRSRIIGMSISFGILRMLPEHRLRAWYLSTRLNRSSIIVVAIRLPIYLRKCSRNSTGDNGTKKELGRVVSWQNLLLRSSRVAAKENSVFPRKDTSLVRFEVCPTSLASSELLSYTEGCPDRWFKHIPLKLKVDDTVIIAIALKAEIEPYRTVNVVTTVWIEQSHQVSRLGLSNPSDIVEEENFSLLVLDDAYLDPNGVIPYGLYVCPNRPKVFSLGRTHGGKLPTILIMIPFPSSMSHLPNAAAVLYHYPCPDGAFAALAAHLYLRATSTPTLFFPNRVYSPVSTHHLPLPQISHLYLLDFAGPPDFLPQVSPNVPQVTVLDHTRLLCNCSRVGIPPMPSKSLMSGEVGPPLLLIISSRGRWRRGSWTLPGSLRGSGGCLNMLRMGICGGGVLRIVRLLAVG